MIKYIQNFAIQRLLKQRQQQVMPKNGPNTLLILADLGQMDEGELGGLLKAAAIARNWQVEELIYTGTTFKKDTTPSSQFLYKNQLDAFGLPSKKWLLSRDFFNKDLIIDVSKEQVKALKYTGLHANPKLWVKLGQPDTDYDWNFSLPSNSNPQPIIHSFFHFISTLK